MPEIHVPETIADMRRDAAALPPLELCEKLDAFATTMLRKGMGNWEAILIREAVLRLTEMSATDPTT